MLICSPDHINKTRLDRETVLGYRKIGSTERPPSTGARPHRLEVADGETFGPLRPVGGPSGSIA